jgi:hypothetical protein
VSLVVNSFICPFIPFILLLVNVVFFVTSFICPFVVVVRLVQRRAVEVALSLQDVPKEFCTLCACRVQLERPPVAQLRAFGVVVVQLLLYTAIFWELRGKLGVNRIRGGGGIEYGF